MTAPARLTPEERAQVDDFIAAGRHIICPPCRFSEPSDPSDEAKARIRRSTRAVSLRRASSDRVRQRQAEVERLHAEGATIAQLAGRFGVSPNTISNDLSAIRQRTRGAP